MFKSYAVAAFRSLRAQPFYTSINVAGLALGLACTFLILLFLRYETGFDRFHANSDQIYRLIPQWERDGALHRQTWTPPGFAARLEAEFADIEATARYNLVSANPNLLFEGNAMPVLPMAAADVSLFEIFDLLFRVGDAETALRDRHSIVISHKVAEEFFGDENPVGKVLTAEGLDWVVTGVLEPWPSNSHFAMGYVIPFGALTRIYEQWGMSAEQMAAFLESLDNWNYTTYLKVKPETDLSALQAGITGYLGAYSSPGASFWLQPLSEIRFTPGIRGNGVTRDRGLVSLFLVIAVLILLLACFNFMNLSSARAMRRAKEVGIRKVLGAFRGQLIRQFLSETAILTFGAFLLALLLLEVLLLPWFKTLMGLDVEVSYSQNVPLLAGLIGIGLATGLLAGLYPAWVLSSFQPIAAIKNTRARAGRPGFRYAAIGFQFLVAVALLFGTLTVYLQYHYMLNAQLGFDKDQIVTFYSNRETAQNMGQFIAELEALPGVSSVHFGNGVPGRLQSHRGYEFHTPQGVVRRNVNTFQLDHRAMETFRFELVAGRFLQAENPTDATRGYVLNEAAVRALGLVDPVGMPMKVGGPSRELGQVGGVVKDFHYAGLQSVVEPLVMWTDWGNSYMFAVRTEGDVPAVLAAVEAVWKRHAPSYPFAYAFLDEDFDRLYASERTTSWLLTAFASLAILVACLGLLGLSSYMAETRTREIGIRKVLGAKVYQIIVLLCSDFGRPILVAFLIALPLAWHGAEWWLSNFAYRIDLEWTMVAAVFAITVAVSITAVVVQSARAALANPVKGLKRE